MKSSSIVPSKFNTEAKKQLPPAEHDAQFRLLVEAVQDYGIFMLDPLGNIRTWNAGAQRIKYYTASEIIGRHFSIFYPEEDKRNGKPQWELEVAQEQGRFEDEGWRIRKDGSLLDSPDPSPDRLRVRAPGNLSGPSPR